MVSPVGWGAVHIHSRRRIDHPNSTNSSEGSSDSLDANKRVNSNRMIIPPICLMPSNPISISLSFSSERGLVERVVEDVVVEGVMVVRRVSR